MAENKQKSTVKQSVEPLLYIHQPKFIPPNRAMQEHFITKEPVQEKKKEVLPEEQTPIKKRQIRNLEFMNPLLPDDESAQIAEEKEPEIKEPELKEPELKDNSPTALQYFRQNQTQPPRKTWSLTPVKPFKDMEIPEKLQYLSNFPANQQPFPCEFTTENDQVKGSLHKYGTDFIMIKTLTGEEVELKTSDIQTIRIAFK